MDPQIVLKVAKPMQQQIYELVTRYVLVDDALRASPKPDP